jgi:hypothetical protein
MQLYNFGQGVRWTNFDNSSVTLTYMPDDKLYNLIEKLEDEQWILFNFLDSYFISY